MSFFKKLIKGVGKVAGIAGDILGGGTFSNILGGIQGAKDVFGSKGGGAYGQSYDSLMGAFRAADEAGLHRLSVAGSPAGYSPAPRASAEGLLAAGSAANEAKAGAGLIPKQKALLDAQIAETRSRTLLNNANAKRSFYGPNQSALGATGGLEALDRGPGNTHRDQQTEPQRDLPARQRVTLGTLDATGPNSEAFEVGLSELAAGALIYGPQWAAKGLRNLIERMENAPKPKAPKGSPLRRRHY